MKKLLLIALTLSLYACNSDDDKPQNPVDQLPKATQTGEGTFACLVDGKPFIADNPYFNCYYQYVDEGWYFGIRGDDEVKMLTFVTMGTVSKTISEGEALPLIKKENGNAWGGRIFVKC